MTDPNKYAFRMLFLLIIVIILIALLFNPLRNAFDGNVALNSIAPHMYAPFGGFKMSGNGREHGHFGIDEYLDIRNIDPIANIANGRVFETLFEKGTQFGILAYSLQNISNQSC